MRSQSAFGQDWKLTSFSQQIEQALWWWVRVRQFDILSCERRRRIVSGEHGK